jgi:hypothetical protein
MLWACVLLRCAAALRCCSWQRVTINARSILMVACTRERAAAEMSSKRLVWIHSIELADGIACGCRYSPHLCTAVMCSRSHGKHRPAGQLAKLLERCIACVNVEAMHTGMQLLQTASCLHVHVPCAFCVMLLWMRACESLAC